MYRKHAARLRQTGGGLDDENPENSQNKRLKYYIPGEGPDESTPGDALNLVDKAVVICRVFCKIPNKLYISKPRDSCSSIGIPCEEDGEESVDVEIIFPSSMFKCLLVHRCKNLTHKH